jgi:hypothetical protein
MCKRFIGSILCGFLILTIASSAPAAIVQWTGPGSNGHWYEVINNVVNNIPAPISWDVAEAAAVAKGGYLATLTSADENYWVFNNVVVPYYRGVDGGGPWIGGYWDSPDPNSPDYHNWKWVTGEPWSYTNWYPGEPDYYWEDNRVGYATGYYDNPNAHNAGKWVDNINSGAFEGWHHVGYVVEYDVPEPASIFVWSILGVASFYLIRRHRRKPA